MALAAGHCAKVTSLPLLAVRRKLVPCPNETPYPFSTSFALLLNLLGMGLTIDIKLDRLGHCGGHSVPGDAHVSPHLTPSDLCTTLSSNI